MKTKKKAAKVKKPAKPKRTQSRSKAIAEGTWLFALAGRPTKYGAKGPAMTWTQRAAAGVDAKHFQEALKAKS